MRSTEVRPASRPPPAAAEPGRRRWDRLLRSTMGDGSVDLDAIDAYASYSAAWNEKEDAGARMALLERAWADNGEFFDEDTPQGLEGRDALSGYIASTHEELPGLVVAETSAPEILGNRLRVRWVARQSDRELFTGTDFVEFADDGRVSRVTMFYDSTPD